METDKLSKHRVALGVFLKDTRKTKKLSRSELAKKLGIDEQVIKEWECGKRPLDIVELRSFCRTIGFPLSDCIAFLETLFENLPED